MPLTNALWITLIGMGLVFVAILLLWGLMALLVRVTAEPENLETPEEEQPVSLPVISPETSLSYERKRKAAVAAAAFALAASAEKNAHSAARGGREPQAAGTISPWLAVNRAGQISQQNITPRKKVV